VQNEIYQQIEANEVKGAHRISSAIVEAQGSADRTNDAGVSIPDQIAQLGKLRDSGVLTEDEFQAKKAQLLDRM